MRSNLSPTLRSRFSSLNFVRVNSTLDVIVFPGVIILLLSQFEIALCLMYVCLLAVV